MVLKWVDGTVVGRRGNTDGVCVGDIVGIEFGNRVGDIDGPFDGSKLGNKDGILEGNLLGFILGAQTISRIQRFDYKECF